MIAGLRDSVATISDSRWASNQLTKVLVSYSEYELGHMSFLTAKDMSYFSGNVMNVLAKFHPHPLASYSYT